MNVDEFIALKDQLQRRAKLALDRLGDDLEADDPRGSIRWFVYHPIAIIQVFDTFKVSLKVSHRSITIYQEKGLRETSLGHSHKELVRYYNEVLETLKQALILEDLANV